MFHIMVRVRVYCLCACVWYTSVTPKHPSWWLVSQFSARPRRFQTQSSKTGGYLLEMDLFQNLSEFLFVLYRWLCWPDIWPKVKPHDGWQGTKKIKPDRPFKSSNNAEARTNNLPWKQWNDRAPHDVGWNYCALYQLWWDEKCFFAPRRKQVLVWMVFAAHHFCITSVSPLYHPWATFLFWSQVGTWWWSSVTSK